jgi:hypothetical protein
MFNKPDMQNQTTEHLRADIKRERQAIARLLFLLEEEFTANGGTFASMETDILFKRWYWGESTTKHGEVFDRLRETYKPTI